MTSRWRKVLRDFQLESTRAVLVVLAIAVGIAGFAAVLASYAILTRALNTDYLATNPASATIRTDVVDDELLRAVAADRRISDVEARRALNARIKAPGGGWRPLVLFIVRDFEHIRVSKLDPERGAWPPATGEILIERDAFQVARAAIGDTVAVRISGGTAHPLRLSGSVHDVGQAQARMENIVYGYITVDTLPLLGEERSLNQLKFVVRQNRFDERHVRSVAADIRKLVESRGHRVLRMDVPTPGKHPHADLMGMLMLVMAAFGLFVMVLSGVIVVNLLTAMMASQIRQIGVMKAIGARRSQIAAIYFGQALLPGLAAVVVATPVGIWGSRVLCRYMAVFLNFDIIDFSIPFWVFLLVAVVGVIIPLLAAAYPVWKGSGVSVREALADFGVSGGGFGHSAFDRLLASTGGLKRPLLLAIRNSFRRRTRLVLTLLTLVTGGLFFMAALNVRASMIYTLDCLFATRKYDLSITSPSQIPIDQAEKVIRTTPGIAAFEGWISSEASLSGARRSAPAGAGGLHGDSGPGPGHDQGHDRFPVLAMPPDTTLFAPDMSAGRRLHAGDTDSVIVNSALASKSPKMRVGNTIDLQMGPGTVSLRIVGIAREAFSPPTAYMSRGYFDRIDGHSGLANSFRLQLHENGRGAIDSVKNQLELNLERAGMQTLSITSKNDSRFGFDQHMLMIYVFLIVMSAMLGGVGGLGLMTTMSLNVLERRREMGVMRAIGASPKVIALFVVVEGAFVAAASWALAAATAWPISKGVGNLLVHMMFKGKLDFMFEWKGLVIWLLLSLFLGALASLVPALQAARRPVREALGYE